MSKEELKFHYLNRNELRKRIAMYGPGEAPLFLQNQLDDVEETIRRLEQELGLRLLDELYQKGARAIVEGQWATAIKYLEQVVDREPLYKNAAELLEEARLRLQREKEAELESVREEVRGRKRGYMIWWSSLSDGTKAAYIGLIGTVIAAIIGLIGVLEAPLITEFAKSLFAPTATSVAVAPTSTPTLSLAFTGKVCQIKSGWDTNTIFLREDEFNALGLPIGTRVTVTVRDTRMSVGDVKLSLDSSLAICTVRLAKPLRDALGVDSDTAVEPERDRPDRQVDIAPTSPPTNEGEITVRGRVCMIRAEQDTETIFLRQAEFVDFGVPAGTTVSVTVLDTGETVEKITLSLDSGIAICTVRIPKTYREDLEVAGDTDIAPPENRPDRRFTIRLPQP